MGGDNTVSKARKQFDRHRVNADSCQIQPRLLHLTMKVARSALHISLSLWERVGVRETIMAHATYIFRGGAGAMIVRAALTAYRPRPLRPRFAIIGDPQGLGVPSQDARHP
jgi:hypothetical protein